MKSSRGFKVRGPLIWTLKSFEAGAGLTFSTNKLNWNVRVDVSSVVGVSRIVDLTQGEKPHSFRKEAVGFVTDGKKPPGRPLCAFHPSTLPLFWERRVERLSNTGKRT